MSPDISREEALEVLLTLDDAERARMRVDMRRLLDLGHSLESILRSTISDVARARRAKDAA